MVISCDDGHNDEKGYTPSSASLPPSQHLNSSSISRDEKEILLYSSSHNCSLKRTSDADGNSTLDATTLPSSTKIAATAEATSSSTTIAAPSSSSSVPSCPPQSSFTQRALSADEKIYQEIKLRDFESINKYFNFQKGKGKHRPPISVVGCSENFRHCFRAIREWRKKTTKQQKEEKKRVSTLKKSERNKYEAKIDALMKNKEFVLWGRRKKTNAIFEIDRQPLASLTNINNVAPIIAEAAVLAPPKQQPCPSRMSDRCLVQRSAERAKEMHEQVLKHIGIASSKEERASRFNDEKEDESERNFKKRKVGTRPQFAYQAGDAVGCKLLHQTMRQFARYTDTVTMDETAIDNENENKNSGNKPKNMAVMMVLNEVSETSMNGGGAKEKGNARRSKPEFIILSDNKNDCKKILKVFGDIFTRDEEKNKKENYELNFCQKDEDTGLMSTSVNMYIENKRKKRESGKARKPVTLETIEEEIDEQELGVTLD